MNEAAFVRRMMALPITVCAARRLFPGTDRSALYAAAPHDGRGRLLPLGRALEIARQCAIQDATEGKAAIAAAARSAEIEEARTTVAAPALAYMAEVVEREFATLSSSLVARSASSRALQTVAEIAGRCSRQIGRRRARIVRKGGADGCPP